MEKVRKAAAAYYLIQSLTVIGWWVLLVAYPESRTWFALESRSLLTLWAFWLPDLLIVGPLSLIAAVLIHRRNVYATAAMWLVTGAVTYATLYTFALVMMTDRGWLGAVLMLPATLWSGVFAMALTVEHGMFREAREASTRYIMAKTAVQILVVWSMILVVFPIVITIFEDKLGIERLTFSGQKLIAGILFLLVSIPGVWSAVVMSRIGKGTPLPLDHAKELVIQGPYSYVRNPMAVSGILQGLAVALFLGSPLVAIYALMGSAIWQLIFRPLEEDELEARFGKTYQVYRDSVRCWIPTLTAYQIEGTADSSNSVEVPSGRI